MTGDDTVKIERVRLAGSGIVIEGDFELPPLARLAMEDQVFVAAFVRSHGSIKQMEKLFGVSYPTIKSRLNRISERLGFVDISIAEESTDVLDQLERGEISVKDAVGRLKK
jgi:hypothetical protein